MCNGELLLGRLIKTSTNNNSSGANRDKSVAFAFSNKG